MLQVYRVVEHTYLSRQFGFNNQVTNNIFKSLFPRLTGSKAVLTKLTGTEK